MSFKRISTSFMIILCVINLGRSNTTKSIFAGNWCTHDGAVMMVGDFNGNGYDDVICYDKHGRNWKIDDRLFAQEISTGLCPRYPQEFSQYLEGLNDLCILSHQKRHVGDYNGDGADDILCHCILDGSIWIALAAAEGTFTGVTWINSVRWCWLDGVGDALLLVGDFNGDSRTDILCHRVTDGYKWISFARTGSYFTHGIDWHLPMQWCGARTIQVGDFDGDKIDDLFCHNQRGQIWIVYAIVESSLFKGFSQNYFYDNGWCIKAGSVLRIGNINNDRLADLLCYDDQGLATVHLNHPTLKFLGTRLPSFAFGPGNVDRLLVGYFTNSSKQQLMCTTAPEWRILLDIL